MKGLQLSIKELSGLLTQTFSFEPEVEDCDYKSLLDELQSVECYNRELRRQLSLLNSSSI